MKKLIEFAKSYPRAAFFSLALIVALLTFGALRMRDRWWTHSVNKQDEQLQKKIDADTKNAEAHETNSNSIRDSRLEAEGRADLALEARKQAAVNSNRTIDPVRKARQRYEETRRTRTADSPVLSDDQLCAELTKRGIDCR